MGLKHLCLPHTHTHRLSLLSTEARRWLRPRAQDQSPRNARVCSPCRRARAREPQQTAAPRRGSQVRGTESVRVNALARHPTVVRVLIYPPRSATGIRGHTAYVNAEASSSQAVSLSLARCVAAGVAASGAQFIELHPHTHNVSIPVSVGCCSAHRPDLLVSAYVLSFSTQPPTPFDGERQGSGP